jgi:hypothetical protein
MWSRKYVEHKICSCCGSSFPAAWVYTHKAVRDGKDEFCSPFCHEAYLDGVNPLPRKVLEGSRLQ